MRAAPRLITPTAVLLGAQRFDPTLAAAVAELGIKGHIATVTAGWQERELEDDDLDEALQGRAINLELHRRGEELFRDDTVFAQAHRDRQSVLRSLQDVYRLRLDHALEAEQAVARSDAPEAIRTEVESACIEAIRELDAWHLAQAARVRAEFDEKYEPATRPWVARHREQLAKQLEGCEAVAIAGGHVAVLVNRLLLFGLDTLVGRRPIFAWSAGAMAVSEKVVLFHDDPPQGHGTCEVLDNGLKLVPNLVAFPEPERRLHLADKEHVRLLARRFAPAVCLALPARSSVVVHAGQVIKAKGAQQLCDDGENRAP